MFRWSGPAEWAERMQECGYRTAYSPVDEKTPPEEVEAFVNTARAIDVTFAEVGAWVNVLDQNPEKRKANREFCKRRLELADRLGAACCVNIAGSLGEKWDGPCADDLSPAGLEATVEAVREILDDVRPTRAAYALETMPWMLPDSADTALELVRAVDRPRFAIHFDPVNLIHSPRVFFGATAMVEDFVRRVGPHICAVHLKDIVLQPNLTTHLQEVRPGLGGLDLSAMLQVIDQGLPADVPVLIEHLEHEEDYALAAQALRSAAVSVGITI